MSLLESTKEELRKTTRNYYKTLRSFLESEVKTLFGDTPGKSYYDSAEYVQDVLAQHRRAIGCLTPSNMSPETKEVIGEEDVLYGQKLIQMFQSGIRKYQPQITFQF